MTKRVVDSVAARNGCLIYRERSLSTSPSALDPIRTRPVQHLLPNRQNSPAGTLVPTIVTVEWPINRSRNFAIGSHISICAYQYCI